LRASQMNPRTAVNSKIVSSTRTVRRSTRLIREGASTAKQLNVATQRLMAWIRATDRVPSAHPRNRLRLLVQPHRI
jgi:hypothetical protein